ncbi:MAG: DUF881 domain-containing protein [Candidatus Nanopelagicales bacterium]
MLDQLIRDALDSGYAEAAARAQAEQVRRPDWKRRRWGGLWAVALVLAVLGFEVVAVVIEQRQDEPAAAAARSALVERIADATSTYDELHAELSQLRAEVEAIRTSVLEAAGTGQTLVDQLAALGVATGTVAVTGPGVEVVLDDAAEGDVPDDIDQELTRVLDRDLQLTVNGLWAAGAEAVAVNGQRLTSLSAIRSAGDAILVNYRPLTRPYIIEAIGNPSTMSVDFADGEAGRTLRTLQQTYGIRFEVEDVEDLELAAAVVGQLDYVDLEDDS